MLDAVSVWDADATDETNSRATELALARLNEVGAITATINDATDELDLDASHLLGGVMVLVQQLVSDLAACSGQEREQVIAVMREAMDTNL